MKGNVFAVCLICLLSCGSGISWAGPAVPVSPGDTRIVTATGQNCPTFSWSADSEAVSYRIDVFEQMTVEAATHDQMQTMTDPVMSRTIPAPALSWTPSEAECLGRGQQYVWYVQGVHPEGNGEWSGGMGFRVETDTLNTGQKVAVADAVREYLATAAGKALLVDMARDAKPAAVAVVESNTPQLASVSKATTPSVEASALAPLAASPGMTIGQNGFVGIGTLTPSSLLTVSIPSAIPGPMTPVLISGDPGIGANSYVNVLINNANAVNKKAAVSFQSAGNPAWSFGNDINGNGDQNFYIFDNVAADARLFIDSSGNTIISGNISAKNQPSIKAVQAKHNIDISTTDVVDVDTLLVTIPSDGVLEISASLFFSAGSCLVIFYLNDTSSPSEVLLTSTFNGSAANGFSYYGIGSLNWVLPVTAGDHSYKTKASVTPYSLACGALIYQSSIVARFYPGSLP